MVSEVAQRMEGDETEYRGLEGMRRYWDEWHAVWAVTIEVAEVFDLGDTVVEVARVRARGGASGIDLQSSELAALVAEQHLQPPERLRGRGGCSCSRSSA